MAATKVKTAVVTAVAIILILVAAGLIVIYSGVINIAASTPHFAVTKWVLMTTMEHSVERRAEKVAVPKDFSPSPAAGHNYREMCELCHGGPGRNPSPIGKGLRPQPPDLSKVAKEAPPAEIFWVVKHGVRMSGMSAFGETHPDDKLWQLVAFVKLLPQMSPNEYRSFYRERIH